MKINNVELTNDDYDFVKRWSKLAKIVDYTEYMDMLFDPVWCNAHYRQILTKVFNSPFHDKEYKALRDLDLDETSADIISPEKCIGEHESYSNVIKPDYYKNNGHDLFWHFKNGLLTKAEYVGALKFNIIKYTTRYAGKNGLQDLQKANEYLNELTEFEYGKK